MIKGKVNGWDICLPDHAKERIIKRVLPREYLVSFAIDAFNNGIDLPHSEQYEKWLKSNKNQLRLYKSYQNHTWIFYRRKKKIVLVTVI